MAVSTLHIPMAFCQLYLAVAYNSLEAILAKILVLFSQSVYLQP